MRVEIREATERDLLAILPLYAQLGMDNGSVLTPESAQKIFDKMKLYPDYKFFVAVAEGEVIGVFALLIMDNLGHMGAPSGIVEDVVVRKDLRGKGIGKKMMAFAMKRCWEKGCYKIVLSSNANRKEAHCFYDGLGFKKHGYSFMVVNTGKDNE